MPNSTTYTILSTDGDLVTVWYDFPSGKSYQHALRCDPTKATETVAAIEAAGREFEALFPVKETPPADVAPEVVALIDVPTEIPAEGV